MEAYYDLHVHTFLSDGVLGPGELARRGEELGLAGLVFCDHVDQVSLAPTVEKLTAGVGRLAENRDISLKVGCELTHVCPGGISELASRARSLGAELVVVHGETTVEPVAEGTNRAAVSCPDVDVLAHPGFLSPELAERAVENNVALELTARRGHCLTNGWVASRGRESGADLVVSTDAHTPDDLMSPARASQVVRGAAHPAPEEVLNTNETIFQEAR